MPKRYISTSHIVHTIHTNHMADEAPAIESTFKSNKRKRPLRKRSGVESDSEGQQHSGLTSTVDGNGHGEAFEVGELHIVKKPTAKKYGINFASTRKSHREEHNDMALVTVDQDGDHGIGHTDRFVRPTGRVAVVEDKHMYGVHLTEHDKWQN